MRLLARNRPLLVLLHEPAVADHINAKDRGELAGNVLVRHAAPLQQRSVEPTSDGVTSLSAAMSVLGPPPAARGLPRAGPLRGLRRVETRPIVRSEPYLGRAEASL